MPPVLNVPSDGDRCWYVAATAPLKERYAIENIRRQGFKTFFPTICRQRRRRNSIEKSIVPLFPGYVFVAFDQDNDRWQSINGTYGVRGLVGLQGPRPVAVPRRAMQSLMERCPDGEWREDFSGLAQGDPVAVIAGPFLGFEARFDRLLPQDCVRVLMNVLSGEAAVIMPVSCIRGRVA